MKNVFIFPNKEQLKEIDSDAIIIDKFYKGNLEDINNNCCDYNVMCCNEEALYFFYKFINKGVNKSFSDDCLYLFDKKEAKGLFSKYDIPYIECYDYKKEFPLIAKPNFGFASIGVKKIFDDDGLRNYINIFDGVINSSEIGAMKKIYFNDLDVSPIYERYIRDGYFFSVPFFFDKSRDEVIIFPIEGCRQLEMKMTDCYWNKFVYNEDFVNRNIYNMIKKLLYDVSIKFQLESSVNMAEVIYDYERDQVFLVEFSPRVPGGRLSELVYYGSGVNLDKVSVDAFMGRDINIDKKLSSVELVIGDIENDDYFKREVVFSKIFNKNIGYSFYKGNSTKVGLIPGRFAPVHKGHQIVFDRASREMDKVVVLIFDTNDTCVSLEERANWIRRLYPDFIVVEGRDCPDGHKYAYEFGQDCAYIQNKYIKRMVRDLNITHVYHSVTYGDSVSRALNAIEVMVDLDREAVPVSATMIRENLERYSEYLDLNIYKDYKRYLKKKRLSDRM